MKTLEEVLKVLEAGKFPELTYVGLKYSKADLIKDLKAIKDKQNDRDS